MKRGNRGREEAAQAQATPWQRHQGLGGLRACLALFVVGMQGILWQTVKTQVFPKSPNDSTVGGHLGSLAVLLAYLVSHLKKGRKCPKRLRALGYFNGDHAIFPKKKSRILKEENRIFSSMWPMSHPNSLGKTNLNIVKELY